MEIKNSNNMRLVVTPIGLKELSDDEYSYLKQTKSVGVFADSQKIVDEEKSNKIKMTNFTNKLLVTIRNIQKASLINDGLKMNGGLFAKTVIKIYTMEISRLKNGIME